MIKPPLIVLSGLLVLSFASFEAKASRWQYKVESDELSDQQYSSATAYVFDYQYDNNFIISFVCEDGEIDFEINADTYIASKGDEFSFAYRVDKKKSEHVSMRVFSNSSTGGYTIKKAHKVASDILGGNSIFVRAVTWDNDYLDARISLTGSDAAIRKVFNDCGVEL